jgi:hypothetical protein
MTDEIVVAIISALVTACIIAILKLSYNKLKMRKEGLRVFMLRKDKTVETHLIPQDSKIFCWRGGQYMIREKSVRSAVIVLDKPEIINNVVHIDSKHTKLDKREVFFQEGNPEPLP